MLPQLQILWNYLANTQNVQCLLILFLKSLTVLSKKISALKKLWFLPGKAQTYEEKVLLKILFRTPKTMSLGKKGKGTIHLVFSLQLPYRSVLYWDFSPVMTYMI